MGGLSTDLFKKILQNVEDSEGLHALAQVSRDFNLLAVSELCSRYGVQPWTTGSLVLDVSTLPILSTLAISSRMIGTSLQFLSCDLTVNIRSPPLMMRQTASLANFLSLLASVHKTSFYFTDSGTKGWESAMIAIFDTLVKKSCTDLHIKTLAQSESTSSTTQKSIFSLLLQKLSLPSGGRKKKYSKHSVPDHLETCCLQTLPTFLQPFFLHRFNTSSQLTTLTFHHIYDCPGWQYFLTNLSIPSLTTLTVTYCIIPDKGFRIFLQHHPTITSLDFNYNTFPLNFRAFGKKFLTPNLIRLRTSSDHIIHFPYFEGLLSLRTLILPAGDIFHEAGCTLTVLNSIDPAIHDITLCLEFTYVTCLHEWLRDIMLPTEDDPAGTQPTSYICRVEKLKLDAMRIGHSRDGVVNLLVQWLSIFPALRRVFITRPFLPKNFSRSDFQEFAKEILRSSASMKTISVENDDFGVWTWNR